MRFSLSYAIGVAQPTSIMVDTFGTGKLADDRIVEIVRENFDLRPAGIIKMLDLRRPYLPPDSSIRTLRTYRYQAALGGT